MFFRQGATSGARMYDWDDLNPVALLNRFYIFLTLRQLTLCISQGMVRLLVRFQGNRTVEEFKQDEEFLAQPQEQVFF